METSTVPPGGAPLRSESTSSVVTAVIVDDVVIGMCSLPSDCTVLQARRILDAEVEDIPMVYTFMIDFCGELGLVPVSRKQEATTKLIDHNFNFRLTTASLVELRSSRSVVSSAVSSVVSDNWTSPSTHPRRRPQPVPASMPAACTVRELEDPPPNPSGSTGSSQYRPSPLSRSSTAATSFSTESPRRTAGSHSKSKPGCFARLFCCFSSSTAHSMVDPVESPSAPLLDNAHHYNDPTAPRSQHAYDRPDSTHAQDAPTFVRVVAKQLPRRPRPSSSAVPRSAGQPIRSLSPPR